MSEHTPGPWVVREQGEANEYAILSADGKWVLGLRHNGEPLQEQQRTNMRLIAAAPELLEALELLMSARDNDGMICPSGVVVAQVKYAIAKAKGETR